MRLHVNFLTHLAGVIQKAIDGTAPGGQPQMGLLAPKGTLDTDGKPVLYRQLVFEPGHDEEHGWIVTIPDADYAQQSEDAAHARSAK